MQMADPILESSLKDQINYYVLWGFLLQNKKVDKFQLCLKESKQLQVCFPLAAWHSSLDNKKIMYIFVENNVFISDGIIVTLFLQLVAAA